MPARPGRSGARWHCACDKAGQVTIEPPAPGEPRRPLGPRDPGDAWVVAPTGERYWGRFGAAGLLALDADAACCCSTGCRGATSATPGRCPGGARHEGESASDAALREAAEEAGVPDAAIRPRLLERARPRRTGATRPLVGDVVGRSSRRSATPRAASWRGCPPTRSPTQPLHPGVRARRGSSCGRCSTCVPRSWWMRRTSSGRCPTAGGAIARAPPRGCIARIGALAADGVPAARWSCPSTPGSPSGSLVVEGQARAAGDGCRRRRGRAGRGIRRRRDRRRGGRLVAAGRAVTVVTSDRGLAARATDAGAAVRGARWLLDLLAVVRVDVESSRPRSLSMSRRSRFVGRPAPRSRIGTNARQSRAAAGECGPRRPRPPGTAPTRFEIGCRTMRIRSNPAIRTRSSSPGRTGCAAFARSPLTRTCPARHAVVAAERVL